MFPPRCSSPPCMNIARERGDVGGRRRGPAVGLERHLVARVRELVRDRRVVLQLADVVRVARVPERDPAALPEEVHEHVRDDQRVRHHRLPGGRECCRAAGSSGGQRYPVGSREWRGFTCARRCASSPTYSPGCSSRRVSVECGDVAGVVIVARGSSDHAAVYGRYLLELATRRPVALAAPSLYTRYGARDGRLGLARGRRLAVGGDARDRRRGLAAGGLRRARDRDHERPGFTAGRRRFGAVIELGAGEELAVPATKTFTAQLAAFAVLAAALGEVPWSSGDLELVPVGGGRGARRPVARRRASRSLGFGRLAGRHRARVALSGGAGNGAEGARGGAGHGERVLGRGLPARADRGGRPGRGGAGPARGGPGGGRRRRGGGRAVGARGRRARARRLWRPRGSDAAWSRRCAGSSSRWSWRCAVGWTPTLLGA